ncbi:TPA: IS982 family transposase [Candidatus Poribacteria bacterium]|nr:IS982 family transposase [Candidatus Poribacteria bacterium]
MFWSIDSIRTQPIGIGRGPSGKLTHSKAVTLLIFSQWSRFRSEGDFYRLAEQQLIPFFPNLPSRPQLNPQFQHLHGNACDFFQHLVLTLGTDDVLYEALDATAVVVRDAKRRGESWLVGEANIGKSNRLGWYRGLKLLLSSTSEGIIIGFRIPEIGTAKLGLYYPFKGKENHHRWTTAYGATVICPSKRNALRPWPKSLRRWVASIRQIVETVNHKLANTFRLDRKHPHCISGVRTQIAAKVALHNFCIWLN